MDDEDSPTPPADPAGGGRRAGDRRKAKLPFEGADTRKAERRSGSDRRATPRNDEIG